MECYSKINKFEKLVPLVGFTIDIYYDAGTHKCQTEQTLSYLHSIKNLVT
jgi:hypothetical protein